MCRTIWKEHVAQADHGDEHVRRRREQFRNYQRRRRAKQQDKLQRLERETSELAHEIVSLESRNLHLFASRGTDTGAPAQVVSSFYQVYEHGYSSTHSETQNEFLRSIMASDVQGPDYNGVDALVDQWELYGSLFATASYVAERLTAVTTEEATLVVVDVVMTMRPNRRGVECLCPSFGLNEAVVHALTTQPLVALGSVRFEFDARGLVTWFGADMDFVTGLIGVLGSLEAVAECLRHSQLSLSSGRISTAEPAPSVNRHDIAFLLS